MKNFSKQREIVLESLEEREDHLSPQELYVELKKKMPSIGIATVYRNLQELYKEGKIHKISMKFGPDRFGAILTPHIHFICKKCNSIQNIYLSETEHNALDDEMELLAKSINGEKIETQVVIEGICKKCNKK